MSTGMLEKISEVRLLVVGDVMLDRYWFGEVSRISPEAPVPVVKVQRMEERLGGAANVARNASSLGAASALLSVVGDDEAVSVLPLSRCAVNDAPLTIRSVDYGHY